MALPDSDASALPCVLHLFVAFDWGDEIRLDEAARLVPALRHELPRRRRTPSSFSYRPTPLRLPLEPILLEFGEIGRCEAAAELTLFDLGAVSVSLQIPLRRSRPQLLALATSLADASSRVPGVRAHLRPLFRQLAPAIVEASWRDDLSEEYFVFQIPPQTLNAEEEAPFLAGLVHLENTALSDQEVQEALRLKLSYSPDDLFLPDWSAAVLIDRDCGETLEAIEFANLQLLEFRHIDNRLDERLAAASRTIGPLARNLLPFWRVHSRPLRALGELKVEADALFERTENVLKLVGDSYLARVYRLVASRFSLTTWEDSIRRKLEVTEGVYQVVSDQSSRFRMEFLEALIVLLIVLEIVLAFVRN